MQVKGLDHVNIVTRDLAATAHFYETLLGMSVGEIPMAPAGFTGRWISDAAGNPIVHVQVYDPDRHGAPRSGPTGTIDHVAFACADFEGTKRRCDEMGIAYNVFEGAIGGNRRLLFVMDPNGVQLELNFTGD